MIRKSLSALLGSFLFLQPLASAREDALSQANASQEPTIAEKVMEFPVGALVEVRLKTKEKLRGRIGERANDAFELQVTSGNKVEARKIAYEEVKGIKSLEDHGAGHAIGRGVIWGLAGVGALLLVTFVICASGGCGG